jgi:hypothetical protein
MWLLSFKRTFTQRQTMENDYYLSILNFALSNGLSTWGVNTSVVVYYKCFSQFGL